ncbi:hypothetical protein FPF71_05375 [Algibacter amylolyticus]|uniref:Uncharacterized protein n=1 Tax=Algibacter amylolyticus TaxID=1608400 RepID=A0A5M7B9H2_9FLAO|nr:hypothetical protein [Algibacter amylolyticus]KAA5826246.1 hypothetical protein F2B50_05375 [Algibacter amylolyticus]MBB5268448.1 hypothetical protein [Algibacter amylolyticus]TSJ80284.1 hypothetical protein FPF71_05375 [Algibacter amylolyticus]
MKTTQKHLRYAEWLNAEEMHEASKEWLSELNFIKDEHLFFEDLVTEFTSQLIALGNFSSVKEVIDAINRSDKVNNQLLEAVRNHENKLQIMVDGVDELDLEKAYIKEHSNLIVSINKFLKEYRVLKTQLFNIIKIIKKEDKSKHLLDKI